MQYGAAADLLSRLPLFSGLGNDTLLSIVQRCGIRPFGAGQVLSLADSPADAAILIVEGEVALHDAKGKPVGEERGPGAILDEMAMFVTTDPFLGAVALGNGVMLELSRHVFGQIFAEQPGLAQHFAQSTRQNLARMADTLRELDSMLSESSGLLPALPTDHEEESAGKANGKSHANGSHANSINGRHNIMTPYGPREALGSLAARAAAGPANDKAKNGNGHANGDDRSHQASDLIAQLNAAITPSDQTRKELVRGRTAFPSRELHQSPEAIQPPSGVPGSPIHDQADDPDSIDASHGRDSSTR